MITKFVWGIEIDQEEKWELNPVFLSSWEMHQLF